jgi:hypothetical protein
MAASAIPMLNIVKASVKKEKTSVKYSGGLNLLSYHLIYIKIETTNPKTERKI